jgi:hypothetical protein
MAKLTNFLPPPESKNAANKTKVNWFIQEFNRKTQTGEFTINSTLDRVGILSEPEFELAKQQADKNGYILSKFDDNYDSVTYKLMLKL